MNIKIGRNEKCPCGSGLKYKKCHLGSSTNPFATRLLKKESIEQNGLLTGRPMISAEFKGQRLVAVGGKVYTNIPSDATFQDFLIIHLKDVVGLPWGLEESKKPKDQQHIIIQWIAEMAELLNKSQYRFKHNGQEASAAQRSGNVQALLSLAYDVYSVYHCTELPDELISRLKNNDQFQGAKYEIAVAAIFARAGFNIEWFSKSSKKQGEFIATHKKMGEKITIEAKSRHRDGVLNRAGVPKELEEMKTQVGQLFNKALEKPDEGNPFMIFIDVNLPLTDGVTDLQKKWVKDIKKMLDTHPRGTKEKPAPFTSLFVTNFSWHYHGTDTALRKGEMITIVPLFPKFALQNQEMFELLRKACEQYGTVPATFPADQSFSR